MTAQRQALVLSASPLHPRGPGPGRRLYRLCKALKSAGVSVDILYYPADPAWRHQIPSGHLQVMRAVADEVFIAPVSRPLSGTPAQPGGGTATVWDASIGAYLDWLFQVRAYTHVLVHPTWLTKAFDHFPPAIVKVVYIHDDMPSEPGEGRHFGEVQSRPAGAQETAILELPDIVLAPSDLITNQLAGLTRRLVLTLSPAVPETVNVRAIAPEVPIRPLRVGMIAPAQTEDLPHFLDFLGRLALSAFRTMSPLSVAVHDDAGRAFPIDHAGFVGLAPVFDNIDNFQEAVDLVIVPSGPGADACLELSAALPVVAVGSKTDWCGELRPTQFTESSAELIRNCIELSFDRKAFAELRRRASVLHDQRLLQFRVLINRVFSAPNDISSIVVAPKAICHPQSADGNRLADIVEYVAEFGMVYIYVAEELTETEQKAFASMPMRGTKLLSRSTTPLGTASTLLYASLAGLAACLPAHLIWLGCADVPDLACLAATGSSIVVDMSLLRSSSIVANAKLPAERCFVAHYPGSFDWDAGRVQVAYEYQMPLPFFRQIRVRLHESWDDRCKSEGVWILSDDTEWSVLREIASDAALMPCLQDATLVVGRQTEQLNGPRSRLLLSDLSADLNRLGPRPIACIDLCETNPDFAFVREIMLRFDVPLIPIGSLREKRFMHSAGRPQKGAPLRGEAELAWAPTSMIFENDAGWCGLRRIMLAKVPPSGSGANR